MSIITEEELTTNQEAIAFAKELTNCQQSALYLATFKYIVEVENTNGDLTASMYKENAILFEAIEYLRESAYDFKK